MKNGSIIALCALSFGTLANAQSQTELALDASICDIAAALKVALPSTCPSPDLGLKRGIVIRLDPQKDGTVTAIEEQEIVVTGLSAGGVSDLPKTKSASPKSKLKFDRAAAKSENGYFIHFAFNSFELEEETRAHLDRLAKVLSSGAMEATCLRVTGHTDAVGSEAYNKDLSQKRAIMVSTYLSEMGKIAPGRIQLNGEGEANLLPEIDPQDPRNRRVEFSTKTTESSC